MDLYKYPDGSPVRLKEGLHGLGSKFPPGPSGLVVATAAGQELLPIYVSDSAPPEEQICGPVASRQYSQSDASNTLRTTSIVEFISYGYSHRYYTEDYPAVAPFWPDRLIAEARDLARSLQGDQAIAYEFLEGQSGLGAWMTNLAARAADKIRSRKPPKPADYDPLMNRVWSEVNNLKQSTPADYKIIHDTGLRFMHIRWEQAKLTARIQQRLNDLIGTAEFGETVARETEGAAFWVLDLYGQVVYKEPASLAAYRVGVMLVRASARGIGYYTAEESDKAIRIAIREAGSMIRQELPKITT